MLQQGMDHPALARLFADLCHVGLYSALLMVKCMHFVFNLPAWVHVAMLASLFIGVVLQEKRLDDRRNQRIKTEMLSELRMMRRCFQRLDIDLKNLQRDMSHTKEYVSTLYSRLLDTEILDY